MKVYCFICKKIVPKKKLTEDSIKKGFGICSNQCAKECLKRFGPNITNRLSKKQFKVNDHYNPKLAPWNRI